ncbi:uncharacterized protein K452DRAFT_309232 [Aplosporella prunicola CBS 121167]|uniref:Dienelactone hydrolase domain-containing protein n=1 Tax=Aplosporella prunicola CBS 121167 TaxID=1176127 RepID=A0A6A6BB78_9PEZI|nr:uncharacterized protein K452DRAFT_309232 [Aplosporella prunicola CBS 121167]KAF2141482.1 hypothetical protein K452DRAFT_309232 [Aplosporella prunicola CBS 121167]
MSAPQPLDPGHLYAETKHISFTFYEQTVSAAPYGYEFFVSVPPTYETQLDKSWPLVMFLHGAGESQRGPNESYACLRHGIPKIILCYDKLKGGAEPSIDIPLAPRLRGRNPNKGKNRGDADLSSTPVSEDVCKIVAEEFVTVTPVLNMNNGYGWNASVLTSLLDTILPSFRVDPARIHLTGFSMGGYGIWDLALHTPARFATLTPICGGADMIRASQIKHVPQWVHHGELDDIIPISQSKKMVDALKKAGAQKVQFTRYPNAAHDCWTDAYADLELWRWMLETRNESGGIVEALPEQDKAPVA